MHFGVPRAVVARPEQDVKDRLNRLQSHSVVLQDWIHLHAELSTEQKTQLGTSLQSSISKLQESWKQQPNQRNQQQALDDFFPINFTDDTGPAFRLDEAGVQVVLDDDELPKETTSQLSDALNERKAFYRDAALGYVLNLLDDYLFLTPDQRQKMAEEMQSYRLNLDDACYSLHGKHSNYYQYFQSTSVTTTLASLKTAGLLTQSQEDITTDLRSQPSNATSNPNYMLISTGDDEETFHQQLRDTGKQQLKRLSQHVAARIDFYQSIGSLSDRNVRRLRLASKGAMDDVITSWKSNTTKSFERYQTQEFAGQNMRIHMSLPTVESLVSNELWKDTVESMVPESSDGLFNRGRAIGNARAKFAVAMLDRELWLDSFQRERLLKSVSKLLPAGSGDSNSHRQSTDELSLLCIPLFKLSKLELTILSPAQRQVWAEMKKPFTEQNGYLRAKTKQFGNMSIRLSR